MDLIEQILETRARAIEARLTRLIGAHPCHGDHYEIRHLLRALEPCPDCGAAL